MSNNRKNRTKKWLISRLKTSGSKRRGYWQGHYRDTRNSKSKLAVEDLPKQASYSTTYKFYCGKINYGLLVRFLRGKVGKDWFEVQQEVYDRIPTKLQEYKECLYWFVADKIEQRADGLWCKREKKYLILENRSEKKWNEEIYKEFYVNPETHILEQVILKTQKKTKHLNKNELRKYREQKQKCKLINKKKKKENKEKSVKIATEILKSN